jgi:hypothetical protein
MEAPAAQSVGLVGDGDEIAAIGEVEGAYGVALDYGDAGSPLNGGRWGASRRAAFRPETCRSAFTRVGSIDGTGTAKRSEKQSLGHLIRRSFCMSRGSTSYLILCCTQRVVFVRFPI